jgi:hypothetical protein
VFVITLANDPLDRINESDLIHARHVPAYPHTFRGLQAIEKYSTFGLNVKHFRDPCSMILCKSRRLWKRPGARMAVLRVDLPVGAA